MKVLRLAALLSALGMALPVTPALAESAAAPAQAGAHVQGRRHHHRKRARHHRPRKRRHAQKRGDGIEF
jgi:hypothetical protein